MSGFSETLLQFHEAILRNNASEMLGDLKIHPRLSRVQQMAIYIDGYRVRLVQAIRSDYPALFALLGEAHFDALAGKYIETHPPVHFNLDRYPHAFAAFVQNMKGSFAGELAILESTIAEVFMLPESEVLSPQWLKNISPEVFEEQVLPLRTASRLLRFSYPVNDWFITQREGKMPDTPASKETFLYVWRQHHEVRRAPLEKAAYLLLEQLGQGQPVGVALDSITDDNSDAVMSKLQDWFTQWVADGVFALA